ncbi:MAG: DUF2207 domain-containing protein [Candidatus Pacearchaeota archaeon]|nr:DUF2207 domain-containing protein [Candidatus Pacearchaeota archaeon]
MREEKAVLIWFIVLLLIGIISMGYIFFFSIPFNFNKAEVTINSNFVEERLYYHTDGDYRTLYRTFISKARRDGIQPDAEILISSVSCLEGMPYFRDDYGKIYVFPKEYPEGTLTGSLAYTENNEYGCGFGDYLGFKGNQDYWIGAKYKITPQNLFEIDGRHYIKFVLYSPNKHVLLQKDKNFIISSGVITKNRFFPEEYVIAYIPYENNISSFNVIHINNFEFDDSSKFFFRDVLIILLFLIPPVLFYLLWRKLGKEISYVDLPETLSFYPQERKAWEIVAFFRAPFGELGKNFVPTIITDFYRRKIIDIKEVDKEIYIKIKHKTGLDDVELKFINLLEKIRDLGNKKYIDSDGFFDIKKSSKSLGFTEKSRVSNDFRLLTKKVEKKSRDYIEKKGAKIFVVSIFFFVFLSIIFLNFSSFLLYVLLLSYILIASLIANNTTILSRYKKKYYQEYQKWDSFKRYLKEFPSMRDSPPKAVVLWEKYLVYATALGVSAVVIKRFKYWGIIKGAEYDAYSSMPHVSSSISSGFASAGVSGGGMGGAGGGGAGGGGGGGR